MVNQELGKNSSGGIGLLAFAKRLHDHIEGRATRYSNILHGQEDPPQYLPTKYPEIPPEYEDFDPSPASFGLDGRPLEVQPVVEVEQVQPAVEVEKAAKAKVKVGEIGYKFWKEFDEGWFVGEVTDIFVSGIKKIRRCTYSDGDVEDLSLNDLKLLAKLSKKRSFKSGE